MNILLAYATNSGGTMMAAQIVESELSQKSQTVTLKQISEVNPADFNNYDLIMLASPSWEVNGSDGMPHEDFILFTQKTSGQKFAGKKFAVFGLGDKSYPKFCGAVDHLEKLVIDLGGSLLTPSLRVDGFFFNQPQHEAELKKWADDVVQKIS